MDEKLRAMLDHHEITKLLANYCRGCDRSDAPRMAGVYAGDSWDDHGRVQASGVDFIRIITEIIVAETETLSHLLGQSVIDINGDEAGAETYFFAVTRSVDAQGQPWCNQLGGRYVDRLVREDDGWKIRHRTAVRDWSVSVEIKYDSFDASGLQRGTRSNTDLSYACLGQDHGGTIIAYAN